MRKFNPRIRREKQEIECPGCFSTAPNDQALPDRDGENEDSLRKLQGRLLAAGSLVALLCAGILTGLILSAILSAGMAQSVQSCRNIRQRQDRRSSQVCFYAAWSPGAGGLIAPGPEVIGINKAPRDVEASPEAKGFLHGAT